MKNTWVIRLTTGITIAQLLLVLASWVLSVTTDEGVRSLISGEGIRWFLGNINDIILSPALVWLLLLSLPYGCLRQAFKGFPHRCRQGLLWAFAFLALYLFVVALLAATPHAVLLSATGSLSHSPFTRALPQLLTVALLLFAAVYGVVTHAFRSLGDIVQSMVSGIQQAAPLLFLYLLFIQFYESVLFVISSK
jgi:aminobenzoyl-glutamate transport protein